MQPCKYLKLFWIDNWFYGESLWFGVWWQSKLRWMTSAIKQPPQHRTERRRFSPFTNFCNALAYHVSFFLFAENYDFKCTCHIKLHRNCYIRRDTLSSLRLWSRLCKLQRYNMWVEELQCRNMRRKLFASCGDSTWDQSSCFRCVHAWGR